MRVPPPSRRPRRRRAPAPGRGRGPRSSRVTRVSRVPNANASTRARAATHACMYCSSIRAYGAIEPLTSQTSTSRPRPRRPARGSGARAARRRVRSEARSVARRSARSRAAPRSATVRRERRIGPRRASRREQPPRRGPLGVRVGGEVLRAQQLLLAPGGGRGLARRPAPRCPAAGRRRAAAPAWRSPQLVERVARLARAEHRGERGLERVGPRASSRARRAGRRTTSVRVGGVDRRERALGGEHLADPDPGAVRPELMGQGDELRGDVVGQRREVRDRRGARDRGLVGLPAPGAAIDVLARLLGDLRVAGGDAGTARHPRGPCRGARDRCPRAPSAPRRACRPETRRRRARAARGAQVIVSPTPGSL